MIEKIKSIKGTVLEMMQKFPATRDNDRLLIVYVWSIQNPKIKRGEQSFREFGMDFIKGDYADPESIRRTRQKIQEQKPELRGKSYTERTTRLAEEMRTEIHNT